MNHYCELAEFDILFIVKLQENNLHIGIRTNIKAIEPIWFNPELVQTHDGWKNEPFEFLNKNMQQKDGTKFSIDPAKNGKRNAIFVVRSLIDTTFQEAIQKGGGYWLAQSPKGDVVVYEVGEENIGAIVEWNGKGWVNTWIAKDNGAEIVDITEPRYVPGKTEEEIMVDDPSVSPEYWRAYHALINGNENVLNE